MVVLGSSYEQSNPVGSRYISDGVQLRLRPGAPARRFWKGPLQGGSGRPPCKEALQGAPRRSPWRAPKAELSRCLSAPGSSPRAEGKSSLDLRAPLDVHIRSYPPPTPPPPQPQPHRAPHITCAISFEGSGELRRRLKQDLVRRVAQASLLQSLTADPLEGSFQVQGLGSTYLPDVVQRRLRPPPGGLLFLFSSSLISSLELNDTKVHEPYIRALLGTTAHSCRGSFQVLRVWRSSVACRVWRFSLRV